MDGMTMDVIVEIAPNAAAGARLLDDPVRPVQQSFVGIAAPVFPFAAMETNIGDRPDGDSLALRTGHVVDAKRRAIAVEQCAGLRTIPIDVAELEYAADV